MTTNSLNEIIHDLEDSKWYGELTIKFDAGTPVLLKKYETIKVVSSSNNSNHERRNRYEQPTTYNR